MKFAFSFLSGILVCCLLLFSIQLVLPLRAQTLDSGLQSENFSLVHLLPDIEKIYRNALLSPFQEAEKKIYDDDIARFYRLLLSKTALDEPIDKGK